jgi:hypothetical protein
MVVCVDGSSPYHYRRGDTFALTKRLSVSGEQVPLSTFVDFKSGMPSCAGLRAHVELSKISNHIVCETFKIAPQNYGRGQSASDINTALDMLRTWQLRLPPSLQIPEDLNHLDPSCCILHMAHNQLILLTTRPIFFAVIKQAIERQGVHGDYLSEEVEQAPHMPTCASAAHRNLLLAQQLTISGRKLLQAGLHFVFNAAVVLLLKRLMRSPVAIESEESNVRNSSAASVENDVEASIQFAVSSFEEEAKTGTNYPRDCCKILQDLNALTRRCMSWRVQSITQENSLTEDMHHGLHAYNEAMYVADLHAPQQLLGEGDAGYAELMTWIPSKQLQLQRSFLF